MQQIIRLNDRWNLTVATNALKEFPEYFSFFKLFSFWEMKHLQQKQTKKTSQVLIDKMFSHITVSHRLELHTGHSGTFCVLPDWFINPTFAILPHLHQVSPSWWNSAKQTASFFVCLLLSCFEFFFFFRFHIISPCRLSPQIVVPCRSDTSPSVSPFSHHLPSARTQLSLVGCINSSLPFQLFFF